MQQQIARYTSSIFHPVFMPFLGMLVLYYSGLISGFNPYLIGDSKTFVYQLFGLQFLFTCFIPCFSIYVLMKLGRISDIHLPSREERYLPFLLSLMSYTGYTVICIRYYSESIPPILIFFILGASIGVFFCFMINLFWKISIHMLGIGGITGMMLTMANLYQTDLTWVYIGIITAGLVGFSRLQMNAHSIKQVALGFVLGILSETYILFLI